MFNFLCDSKKEIFIAVFSCLIGIILPKLGNLIKKLIIYVYRKLNIIKITFSDFCTIEDNMTVFEEIAKDYHLVEIPLDYPEIPEELDAVLVFHP